MAARPAGAGLGRTWSLGARGFGASLAQRQGAPPGGCWLSSPRAALRAQRDPHGPAQTPPPQPGWVPKDRVQGISFAFSEGCCGGGPLALVPASRAQQGAKGGSSSWGQGAQGRAQPCHSAAGTLPQEEAASAPLGWLPPEAGALLDFSQYRRELRAWIHLKGCPSDTAKGT